MELTQKDQQANTATHLADEFLAELVLELDNENIIGITLGGSYARGEATRYSDVDFACFWREGLRPPAKRFFYRQGKLISVKMTSVTEIREMLNRLPSALLFASGKHRLLLDKDGSIARLLQEIEDFRYDTLQAETNKNISLWMMLQAEEIHKVLREFQQDNASGLAYAITKLVTELTLLVTLRYGIMITSDSTYYAQVEEMVGHNSTWTSLHRITTGVEAGPQDIRPVRARGIAVLHLYRETIELMRAIMKKEHLEVAEQALEIMKSAAEELPFTQEEYLWLKKWM